MAGSGLRYDPIRPLLASGHEAVRYFTRRDLIESAAGPVEQLWELPDARRIIRRQHADGRWRYSGGDTTIRPADAYDQLETLRQLGVLICKFGIDRRHPVVAPAAAFLGSFQTDTGDYRGIYGRQYTPNYTAAITELLCLAGYADTDQVTRALDWLVSLRQTDGGWAIPTRTRGLPLKSMLTTAETLEPDRSRPSAHLVTGIVLRAFAAAHLSYRHSPVTRDACALLERRLFTRDTYPDHAAASYWLIFSYPFWWTDLLSTLDAVTRCGGAIDNPDVARGLAWFSANQSPSGLWNPGRNRPKDPHSDHWVALAVCRLLKRSGMLDDAD